MRPCTSILLSRAPFGFVAPTGAEAPSTMATCFRPHGHQHPDEGMYHMQPEKQNLMNTLHFHFLGNKWGLDELTIMLQC